MRKIKFKKWDKEYKEMTYLDGKIGFSLTESTNDEYLQYTGLKDCNGVEIYEGDKLKVDYSNQIGDFCTTFTIISDIRFIDLEVIHAERIEVIGNIYENPELLLEK